MGRTRTSDLMQLGAALAAVGCAGCSLPPMVATNTASLLVMAMGAATQAAELDPTCGLPQMDHLPPIPAILLGPGLTPMLQWETMGCAANARDILVHEECNGGRKVTATGDVTADAKLSVALPTLSNLFVHPSTRDAITVGMQNVQPHNLTVTVVSPGHDEDAVVTFDGGTLSAQIHPIMGEHAQLHGIYLVPTPISGMTLTVRDVHVTLVARGVTLRFTVNSAVLTSFSGSYKGNTNRVDGTITIDGVTTELRNEPLEPNYDQAAFDDSYACTPGLLEPVPVDG